MKPRVLSQLLLLTLLGCGSKPAAEPTAVSVASTPAAETPTPAPSVTPSASSAPPVASAQPPSEAERAQKGREKADSDHQAEVARFTPELRAAVKRLAEASYPSTDAALKAVLASPHRQPGNAARDKYRHPRETLEFFGLKQSSTVLEPNERSVGGYRLKLLLETSPELYGKVEPILVDAKSPKIPLDAKLDTVLVIRELHNLVNDGSLDAWLAEFKHALKPHGVLGIVDHRAPVGADVTKSAKLGYVPEAWAIEKIEAAGFKLSAKSEVNANPKDTKDYPEGVWTLPPTYRLGDKDRAKYTAIGESDRFTLRFVRNDAPAKTK
jgi:predicted methyltransferase